MAEIVPSSESFSFEEWAKLWTENPEAAEARRNAETAALIASAPSHLRQRLEAIQWRVNQERKRHHHPLGRAAALFKMVIHSYAKKGGLADQIRGPLQEVNTETQRLHSEQTIVLKDALQYMKSIEADSEQKE